MKRFGLWAGPLLFVAVLFYWPLANILGLGFSGEWFKTYLEPQTGSAIWFTFWQAIVSTAICLLIGIPGAYVLYRKSFAGQKVLRALITVPLVLPSIVVAIIFAAPSMDFNDTLPTNPSQTIKSTLIFPALMELPSTCWWSVGQPR